MTNFYPDPDTLALGIRQPWVELILRGAKTIEVRSQNTRVRGLIYVYAARKWSEIPAAFAAAQGHAFDRASLATGMLVGSVEICRSRPASASDAAAACVPAALLEQQFAWELRNPVRFTRPLAVQFLPYGVWFYPFRRRESHGRAAKTSKPVI